MTLNETTMEPLYERLLQQAFVSDKEAIEYCSKVCLDYGFNIKHETGANRNIYIYCLHEKNTRKRPSSSNNTKECQWRIVLSQEDEYQWKFRKSLNPESSEHNHEIIITTDQPLPQDIMDKVIQLISETTRQKPITDGDIMTSIKLEFPNVSLESRLLNFISQERKRKRQKDVTQTVQKLIMASTKLCSVVAANEDWTSCVENDLNKMLDTYRQKTRVSNQSLDTMVDLQLDMIHSEIDKARKSTTNYGLKKRKSNMLIENVQIMSIPSCTLFIRSQPLRSLSEPSSSNTSSRRAFNDLISSSSSSSTTAAAVTHHLNNANFNVNSVFALTSPISSPSSTSSIQQRMDYTNRNNDMLQSPPIPDTSSNNTMIMSTHYHGSTNTTTSGNSTGGGNNYNVYPFSSYQQQQQQSGYGSNNNNGNEVNFSFEPTTTYGQLTTTPSPAPILIHRNTSYYTGRESSPTGIQQRMMMQQEYDRHLIENNSNVHLPTIRSTHHHLMNTMVQQQQHHNNMNPQQQNWS